MPRLTIKDYHPKIHKELMKYKSYKESTPRTREEKLKKAIQRRKKKTESYDLYEEQGKGFWGY